MGYSRDVQVLRELAKRYVDVCNKPVQGERRHLWRQHNSLIPTRPLIYVRWLAAWHEAPESRLECSDPFYRAHETFLRQMLFQDTIGDDHILEPWIVQPASLRCHPDGPWGVPYRQIPSDRAGGAWKNDPPLKTLADRDRLVAPHHVVDEEATERNASRLHDALGDILDVVVDRAPLYRVWHADLSTDLAYLRGLDQVMWDMQDNPEWLHGLLAFMRDGVLTTHQEAEDAGDWRLCNHENQAMPYALELEDPSASPRSVPRRSLWAFAAAQELTLVSPGMHEEFMLRYQIPILSHFGLVAYGCCEDLTHKVDILRRIPNLRRIAVTPRADVRRCAEQIGTDYVLSWRPNPAEMICCGFDPDHIRQVVQNARDACRGCHWDITLKDVQTVEGRPERLREWVQIVRSVTEEA